MELGDGIVLFAMIGFGVTLMALVVLIVWLAPRLIDHTLCFLGRHHWTAWRATQRPLIDIRDCMRARCVRVQLRYRPAPRDELVD